METDLTLHVFVALKDFAATDRFKVYMKLACHDEVQKAAIIKDHPPMLMNKDSKRF